jgi:hypothetical protein
MWVDCHNRNLLVRFQALLAAASMLAKDGQGSPFGAWAADLHSAAY